jgi:hypothetical protein
MAAAFAAEPIAGSRTDRRFVWRDQSHDLKIETAFGRSLCLSGYRSRLSPDHLKKIRPGSLRARSYMARFTSDLLPSWFHIVTASVAVKLLTVALSPRRVFFRSLPHGAATR